MTAPVSCRLALTGWVTVLGGSLWILLRMGTDRPGSPPVLRPHEWASWAAEREAIDAAAGAARVVAIVLIVHLLLVTSAQVLLCGRLPTGHRFLQRAGPRFLAVLTSAAVASTGLVGAAEPAAPVPTTTIVAGLGASMEQVDPRPDGSAADGVEPPGRPRTSLPWGEGDGHDVPDVGDPHDTTTAPAAPNAPAATNAPIGAGDGAMGEWVVRPGDHLWSIAEHVAEASRGAEPDEAAVRRYWVRLIEVNRDRLVDPENPDLILPGQRLELP